MLEWGKKYSGKNWDPGNILFTTIELYLVLYLYVVGNSIICYVIYIKAF